MRAKVIAAIVEGHGEETGVPVLLNRWVVARGLGGQIRCIDKAINAKGVGRLKAPYDVERHVGVEHYVSAAMRGNADAVIIILDSDDECLKRERGNGLANELRERAERMAKGRPVAVVVVEREFEAWFLAFLDHLWRHGLLCIDECPNVDTKPEIHRDCKRRIGTWLGVKYEPTTHQRRLVNGLPVTDVPETAPRSYRKLMKELHRLAEAIVGSVIA